jgi:hypothetical protein
MSTLGVVALSMLAGLFISFLVGVSVYLAWYGYRLRSLHGDAIKAAQTAEQRLGLLEGKIGDILREHSRQMNEVVSKINGEQISQAAVTITGSAKRIERACVAFGTLAQTLLSEDALGLAKVRDSNLGAEEYAPATPGERFVTQNRTAAQDSDDLAAAGEEPETE